MAVFPRVRVYKGVERKVWIAKWKDRGGRWRQKEFARKKDAEHHERAMIREVGLGIHVPDRLTGTFGQACQAWLDDCERRWKIGDRMSGYCLHSYRTAARVHVLPELSAIPLTKLTHALLQEIIDRKAGDGTKNAVLSRSALIIRQVLKFALRRGWLGANPLGEISLRLPDLARGDVITVSYAPGSGTTVALNGEAVLRDPGHGLIAGCLDLWLGPDPVSEDLRARLLTGRA